MCDSCFNASKFAQKVRNNVHCDGSDLEVMSLDELKSYIADEWQSSRQNQFYIFKKAIHDAPTQKSIELCFEVNNPICVHFI